MAADKKAPVQNEFSGPSYRVINFVADLPVRIDKFLCRTPDDPLFIENGAVVFVLTEFQIIDARTADQNESGENSHARYKERQAAAGHARASCMVRDPEPRFRSTSKTCGNTVWLRRCDDAGGRSGLTVTRRVTRSLTQAGTRTWTRSSTRSWATSRVDL